MSTMVPLMVGSTDLYQKQKGFLTLCPYLTQSMVATWTVKEAYKEEEESVLYPCVVMGWLKKKLNKYLQTTNIFCRIIYECLFLSATWAMFSCSVSSTVFLAISNTSVTQQLKDVEGCLSLMSLFDSKTAAEFIVFACFILNAVILFHIVGIAVTTSLIPIEPNLD